jgi:gluconate:H+ symporter, GntP family
VLAVGQTIKTWSLMETVLSVVGLVFVLLLGLVIRPGQRAVSS